MKTLLLIAALIAIAGIILIAASKRLKPRENQRKPAPYFGKTPLTDPEQTLFIRLTEALPERVILAQVAMPALIGIRKNPNWQSQFNEISRKYVDFVICRPDFSVEAVIELDDSTHQREDRIKADAIKDAAFTIIGLPVIRFHARDMPDAEEIKNRLATNQKNHQSPLVISSTK